MALSPEQLAAVRRTGQDACCVAGPGSGKTRVLVERFAWLASEYARPEAVLAITFTEKAAREIKERLVKHFADRPEMRPRIERATVSTVHGFCNGLLREFAARAGIDPAFRVMDEYEAQLEQAHAVEEALNEFSRRRPGDFHALADAWAATDFPAEIIALSPRLRLRGGAQDALSKLPVYEASANLRSFEARLRAAIEASVFRTPGQIRCRDAALDWIADSSVDPLDRLNRLEKLALPRGDDAASLNAALKQAREGVAAARAEVAGERAMPLLPVLRDMLLHCESCYNDRKRALGALDFDDLEHYALQLLETDAGVHRTVADRFDAILMDELQDTNPIQWRIVNAIRREGRFFAVGDINQSIFGFRGAEPKQFKTYQESIAAKGWVIDRLEDNYRSRGPILDAVKAVCVSNPLSGIQSHELRAKSDLPADDVPCVEIILAENKDSEPAWIARRILELCGEMRVGRKRLPLRFSDIAILARTTAVFDDYESALRAAGIPCAVQRGRSFFDEPEITDLTNLLRIIANPGDEPALLGYLRSPLAGVGDEELFLRRDSGLDLAPEPVAARLAALRALREELPAERLLQRHLDECGRWARLTPSQRANVRKFYRLLRDLAAGRPASLSEDLEAILGLARGKNENNAPAPGASDVVQLLTVHQSKGLEFPVVFLVSMHKGAGGGPGGPRLALSRDRGLGAVWRRTGRDEDQKDGAYLAAENEREAREREEEDRLLYVAMTRAEERLVLVWSNTTKPDTRWIGPVKAGLRISDSPLFGGDPGLENGVRVWRVRGAPAATSGAALPVAAPALSIEPYRIPLPESPSVSATALAHFEACPRRFFLGSVLRWPENPAQAAAADPVFEPASEAAPERGIDAPSRATGGAAFGEMVHLLLAGGSLPSASAEALELVRRFELSPAGRRASRAALIGRETPVLFELAGVLVRGTIDLWFEEAGEIVLVDYKTDRQISDQRRREYATQLALYSVALSRALGRPVSRALLSVLRTGEEIDVTAPADPAPGLVPLVEEFRSAHCDGRFPMRPGTECGVCPFAGGACPALASTAGSAAG